MYGASEQSDVQRTFSRSFPPTQEGIAAASDFLDEVLATCDDVMALHVILDEICSNIVKHSGASGFTVEIGTSDSPAGVTLTFIDDGVAYDPLAHADPDTTLSADRRPIGGLGILMVKKMASSISYRRDGGRNVLAVSRKGFQA